MAAGLPMSYKGSLSLLVGVARLGTYAPGTSPGHRLIEQTQHFLLGCARQIENVVVGGVDDFRNTRSHFNSRLRLPFTQPGVQLFRQCVHHGLRLPV